VSSDLIAEMECTW